MVVTRKAGSSTIRSPEFWIGLRGRAFQARSQSGSAVPGKGARARVEGEMVLVGKAGFLRDQGVDLTPLEHARYRMEQEAKTVVTRMSRGSKLVLLGDPAQIDNPYVDSRSNGLVYTRNRLKGQPFAGHVSLSKGERSPLAEAGAQLM